MPVAMLKSLLFVVVLCLSLATLDALACSCLSHDRDPEVAVKVALDKADAVFVGTVISAELPDFETVKPFEHVQTTVFSVKTSWKGVESPTFTTKVVVTCCVCGYVFEFGETYLVFAYKATDGSYSVSSCGLTSRVEDADSLLGVLAGLERR